MTLFYDLKKVGKSLLLKSLFLVALCATGIGQLSAQNVIYVDPEASDGDLIVYNGVTGVAYNTLRQAVAHASAGDTVKLVKDVYETAVESNGYGPQCVALNGITIDGCGHKLRVTVSGSNSYRCSIYLMSGTLKNLDVSGGFRTLFTGGVNGDVVIDNCIVNATGSAAYPFNTDGANINYSVTISNSTLYGWTSYTDGFKSFTIANTTFAEGNSGYAYFRPYSSTVVEGCEFSGSFEVDPRQNNILFNDCTLNGTDLTSDNINELLVVAQDASNSKAVVVNGDFSQNAEGEITAGIYGGNLDVLNSMCADGYRGVPIPGTDPQQYLVTPIYYIHFNASGGTGTMESVYVPREAPNNVYTVPACTFTHTVPFKNWTTQPNGGGTDVAVDAVMTLTSDTTLYAKWSCVAMIGNTPYATLPEAITAATSGATITIVDNITPDAVANITLDKSLTITAETPGKYTIADHHFTLSGNTVEVTVSNLNFSGDSYINANNGKGLTVDHVNATVNPAMVPNNSRSAFIVLSTSENTTGLNFTLTNSNIVNTFGTDYSGAYVFGWAFLSSANISNNTFGSADYRCHFVAVKLMNVTDGTEYHFSDNTFYGTTDYYFAAFDLYQNNSRANSYTAWGENNVLDVEGTGPRKAYDIERNGNANAQIVVLDNGTTINGTPITTNDFENEIPVAQFNGYYAVDVEVSSTGKYMSGTYSTNVSGGLCAEGYAAFANGTDPETYTIAEAYTVKYDANKTPNQDTIIYIKKSVAAHEVIANPFTNDAYSFESWNTDAYGGGTSYAPGANLDLASDVTLYAQWTYVAMIGSTGYGSLQAAADAAYGMTGNVTIDLVKDIDADYAVIRQKDNLDITIKGNNHTMNGQIFITAQGVNSNNTSVTIDNFNFNINYDTYTLQPATDAVVYIPDCRTSADPFWNPNNASSWWQQHGINIGDFNNYTRNITVRNCNFNMPTHGTDPTLCAFKAPNSSAKANGLVLDYLTASGGHSLAQIAAPTKGSADTAVIISNCTYTERTHNGINITYGETGALIVIRNTNITTPEGYALRVKNNGPKSLYLSDNHFESIGASAEGLVFNDSEDANYYISSGWYEGPMTITAATNHVILTGGTYDRPVADVQALCAPGYMAIDADPSAGYCTVRKMNWVTFDANGGTGTMDTVYLDPRTPQTYTVPACTFTYTGGIDFLAWNTKADGTGTSFDPDNNETITITSDTVLYAQWDCVAMIGETPYATLQAAVDAARATMSGDVTVKLVKDFTAWTLVRQKEGLDLTIDGQDHILRGQILIDGDGRSTGADSLIIKNINFEYDDGGFNSSTPHAFVYFVNESGLIATSGHNYAHNVLVQNCSFDGLDRITYYPTYAVFSPNGQGGIYNITLDHLYATNVFTPALMNSTNTLTITNYKADEVTEGINIPGGTGNITLDYDTISAELYALRIRDNGTRVANIDNSQFVGANSILTGNSGTLNIAGGRYDGPLGYHTGYDADNDATVYSITGGTFNEDVTKKCAEGYAAFANGTTPETWTVYAAYKVKYVANNGTDACDSSYVRQSEGTVVVKACDYTKDGYTFLKWNKQADGSGSNVAPGVAYPLTADITFYAQWGLNVVYNVDQDIYYAALSTALNEANPGDTLAPVGEP